MTVCCAEHSGNCMKEGVTYKSERGSEEQSAKDRYKGETGGNTYTRGLD